MAIRSSEARKTLRELDKELADSAARSGQKLVWTAADRAILGLLADQIDRKQALFVEYQHVEDAKDRVKLSGEMRLLEQSIARLLRQIKTEMPPPQSLRSIQAQRAARARWDRASG